MGLLRRNIPDANGAKLVSDEASINEGLFDKLAETEEMLIASGGD